MQDLYDTLRTLEAESTSMDDASIVSASGKENLGGGTKVGLTILLLNARVAFEARNGTEFGGVDEWTLCTLDGGNLVAIDGNGLDIEPRYPTAFVTIDRTSSSSATLQEQEALQYSSYGMEVSINVNSPYSGTDFPNGTQEFPVNNVQDAVLIAHNKGFTRLAIRGDITLGAGDDISNLIIRGESAIHSKITILTEALVKDCQILTATVTGVLDGSAVVEDCLVDGLEYVSGYILRSGLTISPIVLGGNTQAMLIDCFSTVSGMDTPTVDLGGTGNSLAIRGYAGGVKFINKHDATPMSVDMASGHIIMDSTVDAGVMALRGAFYLTDESTGSAIINLEGKVSTGKEVGDIPQAVWEYTI